MTLTRIGTAHQRADLVAPPPGRPWNPRQGWATWSSWALALAAGALLGTYILAIFRFAPALPVLILPALLLFVGMIIGELRRPLLAVILLDIPFQWDVHLNYQAEAARLGAIGGLGVSVTTACLLVLYVYWFAELLANRESAGGSWLHLSWPVAAYVAIAGLSLLVARDAGFSFNEVFILVQTFLIYVYIVGTVRTRRDVLFVVTMLTVALALESLVMLAMYMVGPGLSIPGITTGLDGSGSSSADGLYRTTGTLHSPNVAASFLGLLLPLSLAFGLSDEAGRVRRIVALSAFALGGLALVLAFSRGGWLAFGISMTIFSAAAIRRGWLSPAAPAAVLLAVIGLFIAFQEPILARLFDDEAAQGRIPLIDLASRMIQANPWLGVGSNNFYVAMQEYLTPEFVGDWIYVVHNRYLLIWAETGIFALTAFVTFLLVTIQRGWEVWRRGDRLLALLGLGCMAAVMGQMIHMNFDVFNSRAQLQGLWTIAALISAIDRMRGD